MKNIIKKNKDLGVYMVGNYKIGDRVIFDEGDGYEDIMGIEGFSNDGEEVYGTFESDDCGGKIKFNWIKGLE